MRVTAAEAVELCAAALVAHGAPPAVAEFVARRLAANEAAGYAGHGLRRAAEYVEAVRTGALDPAARPRTSAPGPGVRLVDGDRCFGALAEAAVADAAEALLAEGPVGLVGLRDAGHLGRLAPLGRRIAEGGHVLLGFVNVQGAPLRVGVPGGREPRLSTNPVLVAAPRADGAALVADLSTSTSSEGHVHASAAAGRPAPDGVLMTPEGRPAADPGAPFADPPEALLTPLGWPGAGHKGFALGLAVEVLAGCLTGAPFAGDGAPRPGNAGLFVAIRGDAFGAELAPRVEALAAWCASAGPDVRLPGAGAGPARDLEVAGATWAALGALVAG